MPVRGHRTDTEVVWLGPGTATVYKTLSRGVETVTDPKIFAEPMTMDSCWEVKSDTIPNSECRSSPVVWFCFLAGPECRILVPQLRIEPRPLQWKPGVLTIELPGNSLGNNFLDLTPKAKATKTKITKWDYIKQKILNTEETINKMKRQSMEWEKIIINHISDIGLMSKNI